MPTNDEIKAQKGDAVNDDAVASAPVVNLASAEPDMLDRGMPQEFTFFQKKKRTSDVTQTPSSALCQCRTNVRAYQTP